MSHRRYPAAGRAARLIGACALLAGTIGGAPVLLAGTASATPCGSAVAAGSSCTLTGTLSLTGGSLTLTSPSSLTWGTTLNGLDQHLVDTTTGDTSYLVDDATGSGSGWHVTAAASTFTNTGNSTTLANTGTFSTNGSTSSATATVGPTAACATGSTCSLPTSAGAYPVAITTAATSPTASTIFSTVANGMGSIVIGGGARPVGWWVSVPANARAGTYVSTVTLEVVSGP